MESKGIAHSLKLGRMGMDGVGGETMRCEWVDG